MTEFSYLIIDDFYPDVEAVRQAALKETYRDLDGAGMYSPFRATPQAIDFISVCLHRELIPAAKNGTGRFNYRLAGEPNQLDIHVDLCDWAAIVYLNPPEQCQGGTYFWRHRETGLTRWPDEGQQKQLGLRDPEHAWQYFVLEQGLQRANWDVVLEIPMVYNRLLIYNARFFHSHSHFFGEQLHDARLTQVFFFKETDGDDDNGADD